MKVDPVEFALSRLTDTELVALEEATYVEPAPVGTAGLMAWIEHAVDVEQHRRAGAELRVMPPSAAIDEAEEVAARAGAIALRDGPNERVFALFNALVRVLSRGTRH